MHILQADDQYGVIAGWTVVPGAMVWKNVGPDLLSLTTQVCYNQRENTPENILERIVV